MILLCILDGWGYSEKVEYNAIAQANTPNFDKLWQKYPHTLLEACGESVGLPSGQMGNSEVGHLTIGAGRIIKQNLLRINDVALSNKWQDNSTIQKLTESNFQTIHLIGLLSDGGIHSHIQHTISLAKHLKNKGIRVIIHAITDGRDVPPQYVQNYLDLLKENDLEVSTLIGRYYAMDRNNNEECTKKAVDLIAFGKADSFINISEYIKDEYYNNNFDEYLSPIKHQNHEGIKDGEGIVFTNFRADRMRQLVEAVHNQKPQNTIYTFTNYKDEFSSLCNVIFEKENVENSLGEIIANTGLNQLRIAETEKYAHVTYFFNGGKEEKFTNEKRILIPSPNVKSYSEKPEMSALELTDVLIKEMASKRHHFICCNYANPDMVGHTGDFEATIKAIEKVDDCLGRVYSSAKENGYTLIVTADHGNADEMYSEKTQQASTKHSTNKVPLIYCANESMNLPKEGGLSDIAPIILQNLNTM